MIADGVTLKAVSENPSLPDQTDLNHWKDSAIQQGRDSAFADASDFVYLGTHGLLPQGQPYGPAQEFQFSRSTTLTDTNCVLRASTLFLNTNEDSQMALGSGATARAATFVANASCTMQDRVLEPMYMFSRAGQAFGWGGSPVINDGTFMRGWYDDTTEVPNMDAWIINGIKVFDRVGRHGNPTAIAVSDPSQPTQAEAIASSAHLKTKCRTTHKLPSTANGDVPFPINPFSINIFWKSMSSCVTANVCGPPVHCDTISSSEWALEGPPTRVPTSAGNSFPVGSRVMRIGYRVPRRKDADIAPIIAGFASYMTGYKYDEAVIEGGLWHNRQERRWTFHPAGGELVFGYDSNADRIRLLNQARSHGYDVGWKGASKTINQLVAASVATGVPHARYLSTLRPVTAQILQGNRFPTAGAPAVADYVFSMFREINGAPALNLEFTAAVHPSGQLHYLDTTGIELDLTGDPGKEKPIGRTIEAVSIVSAGMASEYFARDTALEFPGNQIVVLASLSAYAAPTPSAEFLEPMRVFYFVPRAGNVVQPARWWGYRVDQQDPKFVQLPTTLSGTLQ